MAMLLRKEETILVKSIARMGYKDIEEAGGRIEKVVVDREPCEEFLRHVKHMRGVSRVTLPAGTWMHKEFREAGEPFDGQIENTDRWVSYYLLPNNTVLAYDDDGKPLSYIYGSPVFHNFGPTLTTPAKMSSAVSGKWSADFWVSRMFKEAAWERWLKNSGR